jgi:1-acyl-sn-glycerol-3-phosphate acyltransferase
VLHEALQIDPLIDVLCRRLPNRFVDPRGGDTEVQIAAMTRGIDDSGAVLIFPEGGNFSAARKERSIRRLLERGHHRQAELATDMKHVAPPRPGGALAAIEAAPHADVVFIGHVGVPHGMGEAWRLMRGRQKVVLRLWLVTADDVPSGNAEQIDWLFGWWKELDAWIAGRA